MKINVPRTIKRTAAGLVMATALSGCGKEFAPGIHPDLQPYVNRFKTAAVTEHKDVNLDNVSAAFNDEDKEELEPGASGKCYYHGSTRHVTIDRDAWQRGTDTGRETLMFHELGHCALGRGHLDTMVEGEKRPTSIMNSHVVAAGIYDEHKADYTKELFDTDNKPSMAVDPKTFQKSLRPGQSLDQFFKANGLKR